MDLVITSPAITLEVPDGWQPDIALNVWGALRGPVGEGGFVINAVVQMTRVPLQLTIQEFAARALVHYQETYANVQVRNEQTGKGQLDRIITLDHEDGPMVQYQRVFLVAGALGAHWSIVIECTCPAADEEAIRPTFGSLMNSITVTAEPHVEPRART
jgi:hypothetical protein